MLNYEIGDLVFSKAGHDKGTKYIIMNIEKDFVFLVDGRLKPLNKAKKKNIKHIQIINIKDNPIKNKINEGIKDEEIKYFLKTCGGKNV